MKTTGLRFLMGLVAALPSGCKSESYVLAKGSKPGWIVVEFENPGCPAMENGWRGRDFVIPESGCLCTSSPIDRGYVYDRYYRIGDDGGGDRLEMGKQIHARSGLNLTLEGCRVTAIVFRYDAAGGTTWDSGAFIRERHPECRGTIAWPAGEK